MITIDEYYDVQFYNECKEALKNNHIDFKEFISIKAPYHWYFDVDQKPIMVNYDEATKQDTRFMVTKVQPLLSNEEYLLLRRDDGQGKGILKYIENEPLKEARLSDYAVFINITKETAQRITKELPVKIWYLGKYYNNKYRVGLCTNQMILNYLDKSDILLEKSSDEPGRFEADFNYHFLKGKDFIDKYTQTPYFENGNIVQPKVKGDRDVAKRFVI